MEGMDSGSAIGSVTSNPSSFEQMCPNLDDLFLGEPLPNPGPIPPKLPEFGSEEEEPFVEDNRREERQCASNLQWKKTKRRSRKPKTYFTRIKRELRSDWQHVLPAAQTLLDIKNGQPSSPSSPKFRDPCKREVQILFEKMLTASDVLNNRMVLPKKEAEIHLAGVRPPIVMEDIDTGQSWVFGCSLWTHEKKSMHILQNTGGLIEAHKLQVGDLIYFYKDSQGNYVVQGGYFQQWGLMRSGTKRPRVTNRTDMNRYYT